MVEFSRVWQRYSVVGSSQGLVQSISVMVGSGKAMCGLVRFWYSGVKYYAVKVG